MAPKWPLFLFSLYCVLLAHTAVPALLFVNADSQIDDTTEPSHYMRAAEGKIIIALPNFVSASFKLQNPTLPFTFHSEKDYAGKVGGDSAKTSVSPLSDQVKKIARTTISGGTLHLGKS